MANESFAQGLLQNLLSQQQPQGLSAQDIMAAMSSRSPMAAVMAASVPQTTQAIGAGIRGMIKGITNQDRYSAAEAYNKAMQQLSQQEGFGTTSASLTAMAQAANAVGRTQEAMQLMAQANEMKKTEQLKTQEEMRTRVGTLSGIAYVQDMVNSVEDPEAKKEISALLSPVASREIGTQDAITQIEKILERRKIEPPKLKASLQNFIDAEGNISMFRVNDDTGEIDTSGRGTWQDPSTLGYTLAGPRSLAGGEGGTGGKQTAGLPQEAYDSTRAARRVLGLALNPRLEAVVGPSELRRAIPSGVLAATPFVGGGELAELNRAIEVSQTEGILPVIRAIAPVTETDVEMMKATQLGFGDTQKVWISRTIEEILPTARNVMYTRLSENNMSLYPAQSFMMSSAAEIFNAVGSTPEIFDEYGANRAIEEGIKLLPNAKDIDPAAVPEGETLFVMDGKKVINKAGVEALAKYNDLDMVEIADLLNLEVYDGR